MRWIEGFSIINLYGMFLQDVKGQANAFAAHNILINEEQLACSAIRREHEDTTRLWTLAPRLFRLDLKMPKVMLYISTYLANQAQISIETYVSHLNISSLLNEMHNTDQ
jgi:hypothetical protein